MPTDVLDIALLRDRYATTFARPAQSRHRLHRRLFVPTHRITSAVEAVTMFAPGGRVDLAHTVNRIPLGATPFVVSFESHMPRCWNRHGPTFDWCMRMLADPRCRAILPFSRFVAETMHRQIEAHPLAPALLAKTQVRHPAVPVPPTPPAAIAAQPLRVTFVGRHFARKGGCVALCIAERAKARGLPIEVTIVSGVETGAKVWTDPADPAEMTRYWPLLALDNVRHLPGAGNAAVVALFAQSSFTLLPTLSDSYGFSVIEGLAQGAPAIVTAQGALPELVEDGVSGLVLPMAISEGGDWIEVRRHDRASPAYARLFHAEIDRLADAALARLEPLIGDDGRLAAMREAAYETARARFSAAALAESLDSLYEAVLGADAPQTARAA